MAYGISDYGTWPPADASIHFSQDSQCLSWAARGPRPACAQTGVPGALWEKPSRTWALKKMWTKMAGQG